MRKRTLVGIKMSLQLYLTSLSFKIKAKMKKARIANQMKIVKKTKKMQGFTKTLKMSQPM